MDGLIDIIQVGSYRIELEIHDDDRCSIIFTAHDKENRRVIKAPVMENGQIKSYSNSTEAISDAIRKFGVILSEDDIGIS
jgi:hypothetical protein